ncbi:outer membrane beta-barrel protein [Riemerella columbina]|uniref:outer membrane beta-barrel protein n=1 Tax=Riemerella columbina TaxID=103810 RepID=UPI000382158D|nr:outer membrane beta-barrel protein [Riemerella columbina]
MKKLTITATFILSGWMVAQQEQKQDSVNTQEIAAVILKAQRKKQYTDHAAYTFDKEAKDKARYAKDLLVSLPELQLDPISNTIKSIKGGKILFLINGVEASDNQIKGIAPNYVVRVEYYDIPPARWANRADTVVNIITRNPEVGYSYGAEATTAVTTGFVNGAAYANYTKGNNNFGLEYRLNYRNYDNRQSQKSYVYQLNGNHYDISEVNQDHFGYTDQDITLRYTRTVPDNYTFQTKFSIMPFTSFSNGEGKSIFKVDNVAENHLSKQNRNSQYTDPTLDLYYSKNIGSKDELILNLIGNHFTTKTHRNNHEWNADNGLDVFKDDMNLTAKQTGIVGEVAHIHTFEKGKLNSGYRIENTAVSNDLTNLFGHSQFNVNYLQQYFYTEYSGKWNKLGYRLGMGLTHIQNKTATTTHRSWSPNPKLVLSYHINNQHSLRYNAKYSVRNPSPSELSPNTVQNVPNIVASGNPYLKPSKSFSNELSYSFNNKYFDVRVYLYYDYTRDYMSSFYEYDATHNYYNLKDVNSQYYQQYGGYFVGSIKPFGNEILSIKTVFAPYTQTIKLSDGTTLKNNTLNSRFVIGSKYKNFGIQYSFNIPNYNLNGPFLSTNENDNDLLISYQLDNWRFSTGMYFIGMPAEYKIKTVERSLVNYTGNTQIFNNKNMFVFGVSYDFSLGKKLHTEKKLNNNPAGAVTF